MGKMIKTSFKILSRCGTCHTISRCYEARRMPLWNAALFVGRSSSTFSPSRVGLVTPLFLQASRHLDRTAVVDHFGSHRYEDILFHANVLTDKILDTLDIRSGDTDGERICLLCPNDVSYVVGQWATWMSGGVTVPLSPKHPISLLQYFMEDSQSKLVIATEELAHQVEPLVSRLGVKMLTMGKSSYCSTTDAGRSDEDADESATVNADENEVVHREQRWSMRFNRFNQLRDANRFKSKSAIIVYTSGTTGNPKGVVHTFGSLHSQMVGMIEMWGWTSSDVILHVLPLNHVHGIVNVLMTPLLCGACCVMLPHFDAHQVWSCLLGSEKSVSKEVPRGINIFMAVPTVYSKLIEHYNQRLNRGRGTKRAKAFIKAICTSKIRLFVSGSAPLPTPVLHRWEEITGHRLLERYGMTELGMALTNPLKGLRVPGAVGKPFPLVEVLVAKPNVYTTNGYDTIAQGDWKKMRVISGAVGKPFPLVEVLVAKPNVYTTNGYDTIAQGDWKKTRVISGSEKESGELYVRGASVFKEYWNKPEATKEAFTRDGWFKTGDTAIFEDGVFRILGRTSVDIIKSGGYKISAIEVERHLLSHPSIADIAVVGLPDVTWGQKVAAVVVLHPNKRLSIQELQSWATEHLPSYQIPTVMEVIEVLPHNAMGKVNKKQLVPQVFGKYLK